MGDDGGRLKKSGGYAMTHGHAMSIADWKMQQQYELTSTQAKAYKEMLMHKFDGYAATVDQACMLFEKAVLTKSCRGRPVT